MVNKTFRNQSGFTLIEMLIVVIILGILAMIIIPQINVSSDEARLNTMRTNLATVRNAIELYYHQHNNTYPGARNTGGTAASSTIAECQTAFIDQLTKYTEMDSTAAGDSTTLTAPIFGPYLKTATLPENPYNLSTGITCDITVTDVTTRLAVPADATGWRFYMNTGVFIANDDLAHDGY